MAMRTATQELHKRITAAAAIIGRGVRYNKPEMELEGRRLSAKAHIENQIRLGRAFLSDEDVTDLAKLLHELDDEDYTADAVETTREALAPKRKPAPVPVPDADGDIDDELYDDEAEDL